jgi:hypothetical protein
MPKMATGIFHSGMEGSSENNYLLWSIDQNESIENLKQVSWADEAQRYPWWRAVGIALSSFSFMWVDWDTELPALQKGIASMAGRFDLLVAFDNNTTATAAVVASGNTLAAMAAEMVVVEDEAIALADNIAAVRLGIQTLLNNVMSEVSVSEHIPGPD